MAEQAQGREPVLISSREFVAVLVEQGIVPPNCARMIIDCPADGLLTVYYECYGDDRLLNVVRRIKPTIESEAPK